MQLRILPLAFALVLVCAPGLGAQELVDDDMDGVPDAADQCIDTPAGDFVDAYGCSVCDCEMTADGDAWGSRAEYLRCMADEGRARRASGELTGKELRLALRRARQSSCGDENLTRCCVFKTERSAGRCRVMDWEQCDSEQLDTYDAIDWDVGSCLPNPCNEE